jgi:hypothetical protein
MNLTDGQRTMLGFGTFLEYLRGIRSEERRSLQKVTERKP